MSMKELFYFPKSDRKAILFLVVGIVAVVVVIRWANGLSVSPQAPIQNAQRMQKKANSSVGDANKWQFDDYEPAPVHLSSFDPNTASPEQLLALGLQAWQVKSLLKYRSREACLGNHPTLPVCMGLR